MKNILDDIVANKRIEVAAQKKLMTIDDLVKNLAFEPRKGLFKKSLQNSATGIISEFKRRSPSRGWIFENAKIENIVPMYSQGGASAISVLTDTNYFGGTFEDIKLARSLTETPILRKDFMVDAFQIYQALAMGASAILLIASSLTIEETKRFARLANELGLDSLLEVHNEKELGHINEYIDVVGVNNRNLGTFATDVQISYELVDKIPDEFVKISESGISNVATVRELRAAGFRGFLMGENFMKTDNPGKALQNFIKELS